MRLRGCICSLNEGEFNKDANVKWKLIIELSWKATAAELQYRCGRSGALMEPAATIKAELGG